MILWTFLPFAAVLIIVIDTLVDPLYGLYSLYFETEFYHLFEIIMAIFRLIYYVGMSVLVGIGYFKASRNDNAYQYKLLKILLIVIAVCILIPMVLYVVMPTSLAFMLGIYGVLFFYKRKKIKTESETKAP